MATKKTNSPKKEIKKVVKTAAKVAEKKSVLKEEVKVVEKKVKTPLKEKVKKFFNSPQPLFVVFILIIVALLMYIVQYSKHDIIMTGSYTGNDGSIGAIHCFSNHKLNVFFATSASYTGEDKKIYGYNIGYYYESGDELKPFLVRTGKSDTALSIKQVVQETSTWNVSELSTSNAYFTDEVLNNLDKLHFVVYAATQKDSDVVDYVVDFKVEVDKIM